MTAKAWSGKLKKQVKEAGTYREQFVPVIDALSKILEQRDQVFEQYVDEGSQAVIERTSDRGAVNRAKNPLLQLWMDLNAQALAYWRDLGLTPAGLKKIKDTSASKKGEESSLERALNGIAKELGSGS